MYIQTKWLAYSMTEFRVLQPLPNETNNILLSSTQSRFKQHERLRVSMMICIYIYISTISQYPEKPHVVHRSALPRLVSPKTLQWTQPLAYPGCFCIESVHMGSQTLAISWHYCGATSCVCRVRVLLHWSKIVPIKLALGIHHAQTCSNRLKYLIHSYTVVGCISDYLPLHYAH